MKFAKCNDCPFYVADLADSGRCHRRAPVPHPYAIEQIAWAIMTMSGDISEEDDSEEAEKIRVGIEEHNTHAEWPRVLGIEFCGEFSPMNTQANQATKETSSATNGNENRATWLPYLRNPRRSSRPETSDGRTSGSVCRSSAKLRPVREPS